MEIRKIKKRHPNPTHQPPSIFLFFCVLWIQSVGWLDRWTEQCALVRIIPLLPDTYAGFRGNWMVASGVQRPHFAVTDSRAGVYFGVIGNSKLSYHFPMNNSSSTWGCSSLVLVIDAIRNIFELRSKFSSTDVRIYDFDSHMWALTGVEKVDGKLDFMIQFL